MLEPGLVSVSKILVVPDATAAQAFFEEVFPFYANVLVYSCDNEYPKMPDLRDQVKKALTEDVTISVVVSNYDCFHMVKIATERVFVLDELLVNDLRQHAAYKAHKLRVTGNMIAVVLEGFFKQTAHIERVNNMTSYYRTHVEMPEDSDDWRLRLLVGNRQ